MHAGRTKITNRAFYIVIRFVIGCPGPDSNRDALRRCPLKTVCLPVPPPGLVETCGGQLGGQRPHAARASPPLTTPYHREPPPPQDSVSTSPPPGRAKQTGPRS